MHHPDPSWRQLLVLSCVLSCGSRSARSPSTGVYRGTFLFGFEQRDFTPDGSRETWWLGGASETTDRMVGHSRDVPPELHNPVFIVVEGDLSQPGQYGHMGASQAELRVTHVLELRQAQSEAKK